MSSNSKQQDSSLMEEVAAYAALSRIALHGRPLDQSLADVTALAKRALPETAEASVTLLNQNRPQTAAFSGDVALRLDERQYDDGFGPCLDAAVSSRTIQVTMDDPDGPYPHFRHLALREGVTHSLSVGIPAAGRTIGALNLYSSAGRSFSADSTRIAGTLAGFAGIALATVGQDDDAAAVAAQLQQALASRVVVSQAQGVLMAQLHCSRDQAFAALIRLSQQQGLKLQQAAQGLVDHPA
jgi:transcriptional regulator with GAF, ATPase, and Fis domain